MTPKKQTAVVEEALLEPATPVDLIKALIEALGHKPGTVRAVEISGKYVRVHSTDRSLRSHSVGEEWKAGQEDDTDERA